MSEKASKKGNGIGLKFLVSSASIIVVLAGLKASQTLTAPFLLAVFFALILMPPLRWLKQKGLSDGIAVAALSTIVVLFGLGVVGILSSSLTSFAKRLPDYQKKLTTTLKGADDWVDSIREKFQEMEETIKPVFMTNEEMETELKTTTSEPTENDGNSDERDAERRGPMMFALPDHEQNNGSGNEDANGQSSATFSLKDLFQLDTLMKFVHGGVMEMLNLATVSFLIAVMVIFMVFEASQMPDKVRAAFQGRDLSNEYFKKIADDTWEYTKIKTIVSLLTGIATSIGLWFFNVEYALLWGLLMFFLNYIPNIGPIIASIPPILLALVDQSIGMAVAVTVWLIFVNFLFGYGVEPRYLGEGLGLSSLVVLLSLIFWGWLLGPIGMFLSAPLTMVLKIILQNDPNTRWIALLIGNHAPPLEKLELSAAPKS